MALRFKGADLRSVLVEALANKCRVVLVKNDGVYWFSERGERLTRDRPKLLAYAIGCNPDIDPINDWYDLACAELGGGDFAEPFHLNHGVFSRILDSHDDLELVATATQLTLTAIAPDSERS